MPPSNPYHHHDDHNHFQNPGQPSYSGNSYTSHHSHAHSQTLSNSNNNASTYNPHRESNSDNSNHLVAHLPPRIYAPTNPPQNDVAHFSSRSVRGQGKDHSQLLQAHGIQPITIPPSASMLDQGPTTLMPGHKQAKGEAGRSHDAHVVLMSGHSSSHQPQMNSKVLGYADEKGGGDDRDDNDDDNDDDDKDDIEGDDEDADGLDVVRSTETENAFFILIRLSFIVPPFTVIVALYTLAVLLFLPLLALPLRLCSPSQFFKYPISTQICSLLLPLLRTHQRLIAPEPRTLLSSQSSRLDHGRRCSRYCKRRRRNDDIESTHPYDTIGFNCQKNTTTTTTATTPTTVPDASHLNTNTDTHTNGNTPMSSLTFAPFQSPTTSPAPHQTLPSKPPKNITTHSTHLLFLIHLSSPLLIPLLLFASWIAASFWVFTMILGNPDGTERRDDGRVAVLGVRNWWWWWLCWPRRERNNKGRGRRRRSGKSREKGRKKGREKGRERVVDLS
ncbi:hypothetical protein AJ78_01653 [Emergomyces pasteurianus Ep9510]|uniref:Uncharacterized protein n=1 Tax=Emergomyces pasteurianus Ep9510 TaxID=1447872 RepID=A0A1J9QR37_9EURO|nr:hypothetical protein AJ78_01653 [Emergomyces pasteurianus Ep9510]